ncbi:BrnA antitoxin family protein [Methylobacterium sp. J-030]|uniref:BrnA antitoxin family protein n=1 Tax=Methylobacterium sp. J-030 TaxID=2836627 RepID=UPI001FBB5FF4|nr:BrnA antitoxin family protein [Methylobacterium sp. J-030]MCJ2072074.1 BrnA antitoxin family protein [Methylobacterium sp. J-030]
MPGKVAKPAQGQTDWVALRAMSEDEIERMAVEDADNPATVSDDAWAHATVYVPTGKTAIHATFDRDVVAFFKQGGRGYQTRMNAVLRRYMEAQQVKKADR